MKTVFTQKKLFYPLYFTHIELAVSTFASCKAYFFPKLYYLSILIVQLYIFRAVFGREAFHGIFPVSAVKNIKSRAITAARFFQYYLAVIYVRIEAGRNRHCTFGYDKVIFFFVLEHRSFAL